MAVATSVIPDRRRFPGLPAEVTSFVGRVADLVAQGMGNKEIAAKLVIAQRTTEGHIEHILSKLGFNSRAQIAARVSEQNRDP